MTARARAAAIAVLFSGAGCSTLFAIPDAIDFGTAAPPIADAGVDVEAGPAAEAEAPKPQNGEPRCLGLERTCGAELNDDCCASTVVPGGTFKRSYDNVTFTNSAFEATVSDFRLDTYEATVGRFRAFMAGYPANRPAGGAGKNPNDRNTPADPGWDVAWNDLMPPSADAVTSAACPVSPTWTTTPRLNESKPMNCITWFEAFAFCIWDGGRLPTEAEWNYAAAGGAEQLVYPWGNSVYTPDRANYGDVALSVVGSKPNGNGRFGQADLAGNVFEWVVDWYSPYSASCVDCAAVHTKTGERVARGGHYKNGQSQMNASYRLPRDPTEHSQIAGVRCARAP